MDRERKMALKIAVCFSGQLRGPYIENIYRFKKILPDADFFFSTWHNQPVESFINIVHQEPRSHYHPNKTAFLNAIKVLKRVRKNEIKENELPQRLINSVIPPLDQLEKECTTTIGSRIKSRNHMKQHIAHAMIVRDLVDQKKYDIIVRVRYDTFCRAELKCLIKDYCDIVYDKCAPMGFHSFNNSFSVEESIKSPIKLQNLFTTALHDFVIIHRADMFDWARTLHMFKTKQLGAAEHGWWQILCEPYNVFGIDNIGLTKIGAQHHDHQVWFRADYPKNKYDFGESLQEACNDYQHLAL